MGSASSTGFIASSREEAMVRRVIECGLLLLLDIETVVMPRVTHSQDHDV